MKKPEISVIMSVYNGEDYLSETIESVMAQTFREWELIVINDCSKDSTAEILEKYSAMDERIRVYTNEVNLRLPASLNKAIGFSSGKYIARMDADDICLPDRLEKQYKYMEENKEISLSSCRFMTMKKDVISSGGCGGRCDSGALGAMLLVTNPILHPGVIARADILKELKYDTTRTCTEDLELWTRFVKKGYKLGILPEYLLIYRLHDKQITATTLEKQHKEVLEIEKDYFSEMVGTLSDEEFYISGIYFKENADINKFIRFCANLRKANKKRKLIKSDDLNYALLEMLAEYKRINIPKKDIVKGLLTFNPVFLMRELSKRKKRAAKDGAACIRQAEKIGLKRDGGTMEFPIFKK